MPVSKREQLLSKKRQKAAKFGKKAAGFAPSLSQENTMSANSTQRTERMTRNNALLLLVDHQVGLYTGIRDIDILQLKHNIVGLTRAMLALKVPVIVTTTTEKMWGPLIPELAEVLDGLPIIERTTVNAWDDRRVV